MSADAQAGRFPLVIDATTPPKMLGFGELWEYRALVRLMGIRDVKLRFRQTKFGALWLIVMPLFYSVGYAFLFGTIGGVEADANNYFVFTFVGISLWASFNGLFGRVGNCLLGNRDLLTHAYFPRLAVPLASAFSSQVDVLISWAILPVCLLISGESFSIGLLLFPLWFFVVQVYALACGLIIASWTLRFRDLQQITAIIIAVGPIFTPIAYPSTALPEKFQWLATANPLTPMFDGIRASAFGSPWPEAAPLTYSIGCAAALLVVATALFHRAERRLADVI